MVKPINILSIEDNSADFLLIERQLQKEGWSVNCRFVGSAEELWGALDHDEWDVLLSDYNVPGMDVIENLFRIRERYPDLPVILVSGSIGEEAAVDLLKQGISDFVLKDRLGRLTSAIERAMCDVRERCARRNAEMALAESEARFRATIDASPVPMALNDDQQNITYLNSSFIRTFGYTLEDIPTLSDWWLKAYPDSAYRHMVSSNWLIDLQCSKRESIPFEPMEVSIQCKSGEVRTIIASAAPLPRTLADLHVVTLYDITERKATEQRIEEDREQQSSLRELLELTMSPLPLEETLGHCLDRLLAISWLTLLPKGGIFLMEESGQYLKLKNFHGLSPEIQSLCANVPIGRCLCGRAAARACSQ